LKRCLEFLSWLITEIAYLSRDNIIKNMTLEKYCELLSGSFWKARMIYRVHMNVSMTRRNSVAVDCRYDKSYLHFCNDLTQILLICTYWFNKSLRETRSLPISNIFNYQVVMPTARNFLVCVLTVWRLPFSVNAM